MQNLALAEACFNTYRAYSALQPEFYSLFSDVNYFMFILRLISNGAIIFNILGKQNLWFLENVNEYDAFSLSISSYRNI